MSSFNIRLPAGHPEFGGQEAGKIPNAQKPKIRPPRSWRDKNLFPARSLPTYTGPYPVATMEIEVPVRKPRVMSDITRDGRHLLQLETVLMTIYYPTNHRDFNLQKHDPRFSRELWLGRPRIGMAKAYGDFGGIGWLGVPIFLPALFTKLPAYRNAPIARHWAPVADVKAHGIRVKQETGQRPAGAPADPKFPLLLFSHGLGGTRTMYSSQCGEFASYGFVVCAVEHRDGSGPRTYVNHAKSGHGSMDFTEREGGIDHGPKERKKGYDVLDYLFPKDNPQDTMPNNDKGVDKELRDAQIALRLAEIEEAYSVLCEIADGNGQRVADRNLRRKGFKASSSHGLKNVDWARWKGRVQLDYVTACGHSFGGATVVELLRHTDRFPYISQGIIYDIWGAGTRPREEEAPHHRIRCPLLAINSEAFTYWPSNFELVKSLISEAQEPPHPSPAWLMTLRGTVHVSQSDFSILYPHITSLLLKAVANPQRALDLNINASLEFLTHVLPEHIAQVIRAYRSEGLLELDLEKLDHIPTADKHKPSEKYIALKLRIRHEWLYRTSPKLLRKVQRRRNRKAGKEPECGDEVWLHMKPSPECLEMHLEAVESQTKFAERSHHVGAVPLSSSSSEVPVATATATAGEESSSGSGDGEKTSDADADADADPNTGA